MRQLILRCASSGEEHCGGGERLSSLTSSLSGRYHVLDMDLDLRALAPLILLAIALAAYALVDLARAPAVRYLPKWAWALICVLSMPFGPLAYLTLGRAPR